MRIFQRSSDEMSAGNLLSSFLRAELIADENSGRYLGAQHFTGMTPEDAVIKAEREFDSPYRK